VLDEIFATDQTCNSACHHTEAAPKKKLPRQAKVDDPFAVTALGDPV
jgi:hypothetical protein